MEVEIIKQITEEFFNKMTIPFTKVEVSEFLDGQDVKINIVLDDPKIVIGQSGQTLFEIQRILRIMLNKKLGKTFYVNVDINNYKSKKEDYLKSIAKEAAQEVFLTKKVKELPPMSSYERRIIHQELGKMGDVISKSEGEDPDRRVVIMPK